MKKLVLTLLLIIGHNCVVFSQTSRCDQYGFTYCYIKYATDAQGNIVYENSYPKVTHFSSNTPLNEPNLVHAPTIPLKLCYNTTTTVDSFFPKNKPSKVSAWCGGINDKDLFATFLRAALNSALSEVAKQLDVCSTTDNPNPLFVLLNDCSDISTAERMEQGVVLRFTQNMNNIDASAEAMGGWTDSNGNRLQRLLNINISDHYIYGNNWPLKREYCFSGDCQSCLYSPSLDKPMCLDLRRVLLHEMGHYLGLAHMNECMTPAQYPANPFEYDNEVMYKKILCSNYNQYNMSCYMECALRKLYCPELANFTGSSQSTALRCEQPTSVNIPWHPSRFSMEVYPTVVHDKLSYILKNVRGFTDIKIVDGNGRVVMNEVNDPRPSINGTIDVDGMPSGYYFVIANDGVSVQVAPIIVRK